MQSGPCPKTRFDKTFFPKIAPFSCSQVQNYILQALVERGWERWCGILAAGARPCAARTRLFGFIATPNRALRAPPPIAASLLLIRPTKIFTIYRTWAAYVKGFFLSTEAMKYEVPCPRPAHHSFADPSSIFLGSNYVFYILTVCCITDMHINDIHISIILRGFSRGPSLFWSIWGQNYVNIMPLPSQLSWSLRCYQWYTYFDNYAKGNETKN